MFTESSLYWITRLDGIRTFFIALIVILAILAVGFLVAAFDDDTSKQDSVNLFKILAMVIAPLIVLATSALVFIPTTKQMCVIKVVPAIANNEKIQGIGDKALSLTEEWLDELRPKKKDKK